jgi:hypothetical protein
MIVPADRRYLTGVEVLVVGHLYHVDSGMGGSYTVQYAGKVDGAHRFLKRSEDSGRPPWLAYATDAEACRNVYILPPASYWNRDRWDEQRAEKPHFNSHFEAIEGWFPAAPAEETELEEEARLDEEKRQEAEEEGRDDEGGVQ